MFIIGGIVVLLMFVLKMLLPTNGIVKFFYQLLKLTPPFTFGYSLIEISNRQIIAILEGYFFPKAAFESIKTSLIFMVINIAIYTSLIIIFERMS